MSPAEAERWLGLKPSRDGRSLRELLQKREKETRSKILVDNGKQGAACRFRLTKAALRKHLPELCHDEQEARERRIRASVERIRDHLDDHINERIERHPVITDLQRRSETAIELLESLTKHVEKLVTTGKPPANHPT